MRFKLGKERFNDLKLLVKQRDRELWNVYERILGIRFLQKSWKFTKLFL